MPLSISHTLTHDRKILVDITGQSEAELQNSQEIARLAVTKSVLIAGNSVNLLRRYFNYP